MEIPDKIRKQIKIVAEKNKLGKKEVEKLEKIVEEWFRMYSTEPGLDVGLITAQSLGEPATQATLRTFHYAGAAEVSVTSGMTRIQEITDALKKIKTPVMYVYLVPPWSESEEKAREFAASIEETYLPDVAKIEEDLFKREIVIEFDEKRLKEKGLDVESVIKKVEGKTKKEGKREGNRITYVFKGTEYPLSKVRKIRLSLESLLLSGIKGVRKAIVRKEGEEYMVMTSGTNLKAIMKRKEVDTTRTYSNDIHEVAKVLGIEAARALIIKELEKAYGNLKVDVRHFMLVADAMTRDGVIKSIGRTGLAGEKGSVFARAAFEETGKHLVHAAMYGEVEELKGVVENLIVGLPVRVGTGTVKLKYRG